MRDLFPGYYPLDEEALKRLSKEATIAVDANVLLNLHRYPIQARNDLLSVLRKVSDRLFVPYQAALEYQRKRLSVISEQLKRFDDAEKVLNDIQNKLDNELKRRHASIKPDELLGGVEKLFDKFKEELRQLKTTHPDVHQVDDVRSQLDEILKSRVGERPSQEYLEQIYIEGKKRFEEKRPPGFADSEKAKSSDPFYLFQGLRIDAQYGDLVIWRQLIKHVKEKEIKHVLFVTDDLKPDWWWIEKGKQIGPHQELVQEMVNDGGADAFHMYNSEQFMRVVGQSLGVTVHDESIEQVRDLQTSQTMLVKNALLAREHIVGAVINWARGLPRNGLVDDWSSEPGAMFDFLVHREDGIKVGYVVGIQGREGSAQLKDLIGEIRAKARFVDRVCLVWVSRGRVSQEFYGTLFAASKAPNMYAVWGHVDLLDSWDPVFFSDGATAAPIDEAAKQ
jgi:hypothetical protein